MAFPSTPQAFQFGQHYYSGVTTSYNGMTRRRAATHTYLKRDGAAEEDMGREQRSLTVRLIFNGTDCAKRYQQFEEDVSKKPSQLLTHPIAGQWQAFCRGPSFSIDLNKALDWIEVEVQFTEDQVDALIPTDAPDTGTAQSNAKAQQFAMQQAVALYIVDLARSLPSTTPAMMNPLDAARNTITDLTTAPVDAMATLVNSTLGATSTIAPDIAAMQAATDALVASTDDFIAAATTLFDGESDTSSTGMADSIASWLGTVRTDTETLEDALIASQVTPAGCADAFAETDLLLETCMTLSDAVAAAQPPTAQMIVPVTMSLIAFAQSVIAELDLSYEALAFASAILGLNRIRNPAAISGGTVLTVPTA